MSAPTHVPDLTGLALLVAIARTGNLGTAAHELGLSVQAATARVRAVEQLVGTPVLERGRRGRRSSRLTARGVLLVEWAGPVLDAHRASDHFKTLGAAMGPFLDGRPVIIRTDIVE